VANCPHQSPAIFIEINLDAWWRDLSNLEHGTWSRFTFRKQLRFQIRNANFMEQTVLKVVSIGHLFSNTVNQQQNNIIVKD
jgi:hypothetical protein